MFSFKKKKKVSDELNYFGREQLPSKAPVDIREDLIELPINQIPKKASILLLATKEGTGRVGIKLLAKIRKSKEYCTSARKVAQFCQKEEGKYVSP